MTARAIAWRPLVSLTLVGAAGFWIANLLISLTPMAARYRTTTHIAYVPMLFEALIGGLVLAAIVSGALVWLQRRGKGSAPLPVSMLLAALAFVAVTALIELPAKLTASFDHPWRVIAVATAINAVRITALGVAIGYAAEAARRDPRTSLPGEPANPHH